MSAGADGRASLTRVEAEVRAAVLHVDSVEVALDLTDPAPRTFTSRTVIRFSSSVDSTFVDFAGDELVSAVLNGRDLDPATWQRARIPLHGLQADNVLEVEGVMAYSSDGEGLHRHVDPADGRTYLYAMSFLDAAPRWYACFDQPDLKARHTFDVAAPEGWTVLGNGPSAQEGPGRWRITPEHPLSTYFTTLVAGPYASVRGEHDGIPLGLHARASLRTELEAQAPDILAVTAASFDHYHRLFGIRYPFGEYHQAFVPDFNAGAMENPGCVTFREDYLPRGRVTRTERGGRAGTIAHEMAHQWFGDLVTMRWWDDLWLNESFAEYLAHRCCTDATPYALWPEFGIIRKDW
ncbi:MAG: aminopeptidase N, partial [Propionibacteriaceae bacterium]